MRFDLCRCPGRRSGSRTPGTGRSPPVACRRTASCPTEPQLAAAYGASRRTVRLAIGLLVARHLGGACGVTHDEHVRSDIPGVYGACGAQGGAGMLMVTALRGVDATRCSYSVSPLVSGHEGPQAGAQGQPPGAGARKRPAAHRADPTATVTETTAAAGSVRPPTVAHDDHRRGCEILTWKSVPKSWWPDSSRTRGSRDRKCQWAAYLSAVQRPVPDTFIGTNDAGIFSGRDAAACGLIYGSNSNPSDASAWRSAAGSAWPWAWRSHRAVYCTRACRSALSAAIRCAAWSARACRASRRAGRSLASRRAAGACESGTAGPGAGASGSGPFPGRTACKLGVQAGRQPSQSRV